MKCLASLKGFKFALAAGRQISTLRENNLSLQAELKNAQEELARVEQSVEPLRKEAREAEAGRKAALAEVTRLGLSIDAEVLRSLRRREEREGLRRENTLLEAENRFLRETVADLEADDNPSFEDGYFTATYEVVQRLPADFDLQAAFGWSRETILAKANELVAADAGALTEASQDPDIPGPSVVNQDAANEEGAHDPSVAQGEKMPDVVPSPVVIVVDEESTQVEARITEVQATGGVEDPAETEDPKRDEAAKEQEDA